jgi:hypothetical protein
MENQDFLLIESIKDAIVRDNQTALKQFESYVPKEFIEKLKKEHLDSISTKKVEEVIVEKEESFEYEDSYESVEDSSLDVPHDLVSLPSKGLLYKKGKSKIPVAYLTASDEDLITSPLLYQEGKIIDVLLRKKILDKTIKPEDLCQGDRDAIVIWLRATGYGYEFPITVTDPVTRTNFDSVVDLGKLKLKEFDLKPNKNGFFEYKLPLSESLVEFRFLTYKDEVEYNKFLQKTNTKVKKAILESTSTILKDVLIEDTSDKVLIDAFNTINEHINSIKVGDIISTPKAITYRLEKSIVSVDGNKDKAFINKFVSNMRAQDSLSLRRFITENTPSVDYTIEIQRPESLGGGAGDTFQSELQLDQNVFLNV